MNLDKKTLYDKFQEDFPLDGLENMSLEKYTNLNKKDSIKSDKLLTDGKMIGHSYFCHFDKKSQSETAWWQDILNYQVLPYLEEICFDEKDQYVKMKTILTE